LEFVKWTFNIYISGSALGIEKLWKYLCNIIFTLVIWKYWTIYSVIFNRSFLEKYIFRHDPLTQTSNLQL
jgi:hypothetical protein